MENITKIPDIDSFRELYVDFNDLIGSKERIEKVLSAYGQVGSIQLSQSVMFDQPRKVILENLLSEVGLLIQKDVLDAIDAGGLQAKVVTDDCSGE